MNGLIGLLLFLCINISSSATEIENFAVHADQEGNAWSIAIEFSAPYPVTEAWAVMTDYERMTSFMPYLFESHVQNQGNNRLQVSQKGKYSLGPFSYEFESTRNVVLTPPYRIESKGITGSAKQQQTQTDLSPEAGGTHVSYRAKWIYDGWWASLVSKNLVVGEARHQFQAMVDEMQKRHNETALSSNASPSSTR